MAKGFLVSYAGYPYTPSSLMPDNGLASLAGSLLNAGHEVTILDYGTVEIIDRLTPAFYKDRLESIYDALADNEHGGLWNRLCRLYRFTQLKRLDGTLSALHNREVAAMAEELSAFTSRERPDFIGFKLWNGDGFYGSILMAEIIRRDHPHIRIYGGGPHVYLFREMILQKTDIFDALVCDEGEEALLRLVESNTSLKDIPNIIYKDKGRIVSNPVQRPQNLNDLPYPVYDESVYPAMKGNSKIKVMVLDESRGCIYTCPFCPQSSRDDNKWRKKSAVRIVDEVERAYKKTGVKLFRFGGQFTPGKLMEEVAVEILRRELKIMFTSFSHINTMRNTDFSLLRQAGLTAVFFGVESCSQTILDGSLEKHTTVEDIEAVLLKSKEAGIITVVSIIYPAPGDNEITRMETIRTLLRVRPDSVLVYFPGIYPHSRWARNPEKYNIHLGKNYAEDNMDYKIKTMYPPQFWKPLPYTVDGKDFKTFTAETAEFVAELERNNLTTYMTDESMLLSRILNIEASKYASEIKRMFYVGEKDAIADLVEKINEKAIGHV